MTTIQTRYVDTIDLFSNGNFVRSFDDMDELEKYLEDDYTRSSSYFSYDSIIDMFNKRKYSIINSRRILFEKKA